MTRQKSGFTLIELIIVVVILGILGATAAPRFIDIQSNARAASLEGIAAALQGGSQLVFANSAINGVQALASSSVNLDNDDNNDISIAYGYPDPTLGAAIDGTTALSQFSLWVDLDLLAPSTGTDSNINFSVTDNTITISQTGMGARDDCKVDYTGAAGAGLSPTITVVSSGC